MYAFTSVSMASGPRRGVYGGKAWATWPQPVVNMAIDSSTLHSLLSMEEGPTLDFKREQYRFDKASDEDKSKLLKDILAFANTQRSRTAYILVGVGEVKGGRGKVVGVDDHLDDANLHQFVSSKTSRPVEFTYSAFVIEGKIIGVIDIPIQRRPIWAKKDYGEVKANKVYIRDGSSTRPASPDEIAAMGRHNPPMLQVEWGDASRRIVYPPDYVHRSTDLKLPDQFQTWKSGARHYDYQALARELGEDTSRYTEDSFNSVRTVAMNKPLGLRFYNNSGSVGENVKFAATLEDKRLLSFRRTPSDPDLPYLAERSSRQKGEIRFAPSGNGIELAVEAGRIRPGECIWTKPGAWLSTKKGGTLIWKGTFVADNLPEPIECLLPLQVEYEEREIQPRDLKSSFDPLPPWLP